MEKIYVESDKGLIMGNINEKSESGFISNETFDVENNILNKVNCVVDKGVTLIIPETVNLLTVNSLSNIPNYITDIIVNDTVTRYTEWGENPFVPTYGIFYNSKMKNVTLPNNLTSIAKYMFVDCDNLINLNIPSSCTIIRDDAFNNAFKYNSNSKLVLPNNLINIGKRAFLSCHLKYIYIPKSCVNLGEECFDNCSITDIYYGGTETEWNNLNVSWQGGTAKTVHFNSTPNDIP